MAEPPRPGPIRLVDFPNELLFLIVRHSIAVGRERDVSALARTCKRIHKPVNDELYKLVSSRRTFYIVHWAAQRNRAKTLEIAFENGANPNQLSTSTTLPKLPDSNDFRPVDWGLNTMEKLDWAIMDQSAKIGLPLDDYPTSARWDQVWFSSVNLSKTSINHLRTLHSHYSRSVEWSDSLLPGTAHHGTADTCLVHLPPRPDEHFTFPQTMSQADIDDWDVKLCYLRLFKYWHSPLHLAAQSDSAEATQALISTGADVDAISVGVCGCNPQRMPRSRPISLPGNRIVSCTALHVAICVGSYRAARVLVSHGADRMAKVFSGLDNRDWISENALHRALSIKAGRMSNYEFIKFLLDNGFRARIEERSHEGLTPLLLACNAIEDPGRERVVELLLQYGADLEHRGPTYPRCRLPWLERIPGVEWATAAIWALVDNQFLLAGLLLEHGADVRAKSSLMQGGMLHFVCLPGGYEDVTPGRIGFLDILLERSTEEDVNDPDMLGRTPLAMLIGWNLWNHEVDTSEMESRLFEKGADIMANFGTGWVTPFEYLVRKLLYLYYDTLKVRSHIGDKVVAILRRSRINESPRRPRAAINSFWGCIFQQLQTTERLGLGNAPFILHALIKAGFSPAEVDAHGDTAMTSFLRLLFRCPFWVTFSERSLFLSLMALLQEHSAPLHQRNEDGDTAFDLLQRITEYDGDNTDSARLGSIMRVLVQPGQDEQGNMCFKFHPTKYLLGGLGNDPTLLTIQRNPSRWLVCEHWCRFYCGDEQCECASPNQTSARCNGDCCIEEDHDWIDDEDEDEDEDDDVD